MVALAIDSHHRNSYPGHLVSADSGRFDQPSPDGIRGHFHLDCGIWSGDVRRGICVSSLGYSDRTENVSRCVREGGVLLDFRL
jgi:hypothetical protein